MKRLVLYVAITTTACELGPQGESPIDCVSTDNCASGDVCFLGRCIDPGFNITDVHLDTTPPSSSGLLPQVDVDSPRDLRASSRHDVTLRSSVIVRGRVHTGQSEDRSGVLMANRLPTAGLPRLPSTTMPIQTGVAGAFSFGLVPGEYTLTFDPSGSEGSLPPYAGWFDAARPFSTDGASGDLELIYPLSGDLVRVTGTVIANRSMPLSTVGGVSVSGTARDAQGNELASTTDTTLDDGRFELVFPPGALPGFNVRVRPADNDEVPTADRILNYAASGSPELQSFSLEIGDITKVTARLRTDDGAEVANATVLFEGRVGVDSFTATATTGPQGSVENVPLLPGIYTVTAAPSRTGPFALGSKLICVGAELASTCEGEPVVQSVVDIQVGNKVRLVGYVTAHNGMPVGGARLVATLRGAPVTREFSTMTRSDGGYTLDVDPGSAAAPAEYEIVIEPEQIGGEPLPRHRDIVQVDAAMQQELSFRLYASSLLHGRVYDPAGRPLRDVRVAVYATEAPLGSLDEPLLVGLGQSTEDGEFVVPIPIPD